VRRVLLAAAFGALLLAGCSSPSSPGAPSPTHADSAEAVAIRVVAAASLTEVFGRIAEDFEEAHPGASVELSFGGSSGLAAQLVEGAPADVFAAASPETIATVADAGLVQGDPVVFARNRLEIAVPPGNPGGVEGLASLAQPELTVALCDVAVPCGAVAERVFAAAGLTPAPDTLEQDVKSVLTKVELGEVDAGLVYRTDVLAAGDRVEGIPFAEAEGALTDYPIAALTSAGPEAEEFVRWVTEKGGPALEEAGFVLP
jgi:molybdate transport system substrate-binding protein